MPGIANKYFPIRATTLSVLGMTSALAGTAAAPGTVPGYALGVFGHLAAPPGGDRGVTGVANPGAGFSSSPLVDQVTEALRQAGASVACTRPADIQAARQGLAVGHGVQQRLAAVARQQEADAEVQ